MSKSSTTAELGIEAVAQRSGLSQHLIRIWERRYAVVNPSRTDANRRLYSEADAVRLELLNRAVHAGHRISDIAHIPTPKLEQLVKNDRPTPTVSRGGSSGTGSDFVELAMAATMKFDSESLGRVLSQADVELGQAHCLDQVILPLMERIGSKWKQGDARISHEHMATAVVTHHVGSALDNFRCPVHAPVIVVATPVGQMHEVGALVAGLAAAFEGWRPIYLGASMPADEIAGTAQKSGARAVALGLVFPSDDPRLPPELNRLRRLLSDKIALFIGGSAAEAYETAIDSARAIRVMNVDDFRQRLNSLRTSLG
jgi:MerR family transcriptional regulator, light-induced transcriptional regulator